jgi:NAD(P)-dependent dehydrogenase (short-subunit alcohol dehydrogenase family)
VLAGFRGGRYVSAEASARGEWAPGGSKLPGGDAYATSKQCNLATVLVLARELPRLRVNAVEPGFNPATDLGRDSSIFLRLLAKYVLSPLAPFIKKGRPMQGSRQVHQGEFTERVVAETRALLARVPV